MTLAVNRDESDWHLRRSTRRRVSLIAEVAGDAGNPVRVLVRNISYEGCELLSERPLEIGQSVRLSMPGGSVINGQVRWIAGDRAGLSFLLGNSAVEERRSRIGV